MSSNSSVPVSNIVVESWEPLDNEEPTIHHLPFKIAHTGLAQVSKYLNVKYSSIKGYTLPESDSKSPISA